MKVIIVGAHGEAKELINRVSSGWSISVIDLDQEKLRNFTTNRQIDKIQGDATSSLVLKKAGLDEATAIVTLTLSDEVNLEILKIAKQNDILRLSSIINDSSNIDKFKELDVELVEPDILLARRFEHILEPRRVVSQAFAGGRAEALEIEISSDSPVRGKKLREIGSDYYIVGALLRKGKVIIPHGDTEIETGDLVTIVLQSGAFSNVINLFSGSESRFPLEFGKDIVVVLDNEKNLKYLSESEFFIRNTKATSLKLITKEDLFDNNLESTEETLKAVLKDQEFDITYKNKISNKDLENYKGITVVERKENDKGKSYGEGWHTDSSYLEKTPKYTCLMGKIVKKDQGQTLFASQLASYEALDQETKDKIQNLVGIFSSAGPISVTRLEREAERGTGKSKDFVAEHQIVKKVGTRKTLYLSPGHTIAIKNLPEKESKDLLKYLFNHQTKKEFQNSFFWEKNTIVIWDNHSVIHSATPFQGRRMMHRIILDA